MARDYKVQFRSEETLALSADRLRKLAHYTSKYTIDIIDLIERVLVRHFAALGKELKIDLFIREKFDDPAYVKPHNSGATLYVDRQVWKDAKNGLAYAYFILAHEIGHLLFHDDTAVAYSDDARLRLKSFVDEESAEWQADTFAKYLTIPDEVLRKFFDPDVIGILCNVEQKVIIERIQRYRRTGPMIKISYEGEACGECGNFTLVRNGTCLKCDTCGGTTGCS